MFVPLLSGVEGLATQTALEFLLCQDTFSRVSSPILKSSEFPFYMEIGFGAITVDRGSWKTSTVYPSRGLQIRNEFPERLLRSV